MNLKFWKEGTVRTLGHEKITVSALVLPFKLGPELEGVGAGETGNSIVTVIVDRQTSIRRVPYPIWKRLRYE